MLLPDRRLSLVMVCLRRQVPCEWSRAFHPDVIGSSGELSLAGEAFVVDICFQVRTLSK